MTSAQPGPILTLDAVRHAFGPRQALKGVSLAVRPGEIYALLGPNGAGKSTLVRVICGRIPPDSGTARIDGRDPFADGHARAMLGLAPQALALYPLLTVAENLEAFAHLAGLRGSAVRPAVTEAMAVTRVEARAGSQVRHLSGGFQRRVNIAAAILAKPRLLVLDEPTVGIDQAACEAVAEVLRQLRESGVGILLVTHDLAQAEGLADRVGFLRDGLKVLEGEPRALLADAFGGAMEVEVLIEADAAMCSRLSAEGLQPGREAGSWTCLDVDGFGRAAALAAQLAAVGLAPREIRVRRPALEHLVGRLAEPDLAA